MEAVHFDTAGVLAEQRHHARLVRVDDEEAQRQNRDPDEQHKRERDQRRLSLSGVDEEPDRGGHRRDQEGEHQPAGHGRTGLFANHGRLQGVVISK